MIAEWIVAGSLSMAVVLAVLTIIVTACVHNRIEGGGIFAAFVFLAAWAVFGDLVKVVQSDPRLLLWGTLGYVGVGLLWCVPSWVLFLDKIKRAYSKRLAQFRIDRKIAGDANLAPEYWGSWATCVCYDPFRDAGMDYNSETGVLTPPQFSNNKERITGWALLWPWSMLDALLGDVVRRGVEKIIELYRRMFQAISDWMFRGL